MGCFPGEVEMLQELLWAGFATVGSISNIEFWLFGQFQCWKVIEALMPDPCKCTEPA